MAVEPTVMTAEPANAFVGEEMKKWKAVAASSKIQVG
jgi:hypothetical protein